MELRSSCAATTSRTQIPSGAAVDRVQENLAPGRLDAVADERRLSYTPRRITSTVVACTHGL
jgi:hypothetical protein